MDMDIETRLKVLEDRVDSIFSELKAIAGFNVNTRQFIESARERADKLEGALGAFDRRLRARKL